MVDGSMAQITFIAFFVAVMFVDFYDISLPRGDAVALSGPIVAFAVHAFGLPLAFAVGVGSSAIIQLARHLARGQESYFEETAVRILSVLFAAAGARALAAAGAENLAFVIVPATYLTMEFVGQQVVYAVRCKRSLRRVLLGNLARQKLLLAAQLSAAVLTTLTFYSLGVWSVIPAVALVLLMRQAYSMLLKINETYLTTVSVLVEAAESQTPGLVGHSERTAVIARNIGERCGLNTSDIECLNYAALLHDLGRIADADDAPYEVNAVQVVQGIDFFARVVPVLELLNCPSAEQVDESNLFLCFIVALASDIDAVLHPAVGIGEPWTAKVSPRVPSKIKAQVVSSAVSLGFSVPAIQ